MAKTDAWGIELGADAIKAMHLSRTAEGVELLEYEVLPFKQILTTPDINVDEQIQLNLDAFLAKHDLKKSAVVVSVPGNMAFARFAKLPPVDPKKIPDIVKFEAVQQIPFPIDQVEWDYQVFQQPDSPDVEVGIFAITKDRVMQWLSHFRRAGITVDALTLSPLAVFNAFSHDMQVKDDDEGVILMDIGTSSTDVIIVERGGIWLRTLPMGGNAFTEALVRAFKLSFPKAEKLKREAATSKYARQIFQAMRPVFADLVQEIQRSLGYYQSLNRDANLTKLIGVGSTFKLPGLQKFLKQQLQMEVIRPDKYERIHPAEGKQEAEFAENAIKLATAYGLALQGLGLEKVSANILPTFILKQRMWKAKQPWIAAAAMLCLAASGLAALRLFNEKRAFAEDFAQLDRQIQMSVNKASSLAQEWQTISTSDDPRQRIENLRRILDYRDIWPKIMADIAQALAALQPQPQTLSPDRDAQAEVPRKQRRRLYIDSITARYSAGTAAEAGSMDPAMGGPMGGPPAGPGSAGVSAYDWGSPPSEPTPGMAGPGGPGAPPTPGGSIASDDPGRQPPTFTITITGTTPFGTSEGEVARFLREGLTQWLEQAKSRSDRPYTLVGVDRPIVSITPVTAASLPGGGSGGTVAPLTSPPPIRGRQSIRGGMPITGGWDQGGFAGGGQAGPQTSTLESLLPQRPEDDRPMPGDHQFVISWRVRLIPPDQARQSEEKDTAAVEPGPQAANR